MSKVNLPIWVQFVQDHLPKFTERINRASREVVDLYGPGVVLDIEQWCSGHFLEALAHFEANVRKGIYFYTEPENVCSTDSTTSGFLELPDASPEVGERVVVETDSFWREVAHLTPKGTFELSNGKPIGAVRWKRI